MADLRIHAASTVPAAPRPAPALESGKADGFGATLNRALGEVNDLQLRARDASVELASGQTQDLAATLLTIEKANVSFQFAVQIRNKLLEAYQEIMRMPV